MKKGNKILVVLIVIIILLSIAGGAFAYAYLATDLLKTDAELFNKYLSQVTAEDGFIDKNIKEFQEKKQQNPYENSGKFTVTANLPEGLGKGAEQVNNLEINFSGKSDEINNKTEKDFEIDYGKGVTFPVTYKKDNNAYGLKIDRVSSKFVAIRNENLKQFAQNLGINDVSEIPNKIEVTETKEKVEFTQEELGQLKQIYGAVLDEQLTEENFSKVKTSDGENYMLELGGEQLKNVIIKMLETTKQNTLLIDKVNQLMLQISEDSYSLEAEDIDELIEEVNGIEISEISNLKVTLGQKDKLLNQILIEYGDNRIEITKNKNATQLGYEINIEIKEVEELNGSYNMESTEDTQLNLYLSLQYTGLETLSNVQENYKIGFETLKEDENVEYEYNIDNNVTFKDVVTIDSFDDKTVFLNDHDGETVENFITQLGEKILEVNKEQMQELGLEKNENPLIYSNPITLVAGMVYNTALDSITSATDSLEQQANEAFNATFETYEGTQTGSHVNALLMAIVNSNMQYQDESNKIVKVTLDGTEIITGTETTLTTRADTGKNYTVEAIYSSEGLITEMTITTNE